MMTRTKMRCDVVVSQELALVLSVSLFFVAFLLFRLTEQATRSSNGQAPEADSSKQGARSDYKVISNALRALVHLARGGDASSTLPIYEVTTLFPFFFV